MAFKKQPVAGNGVPLKRERPGGFKKDNTPDTLPLSERKRISDETIRTLEERKDGEGLTEAALRITLDSSGNKKCVNALGRLIEGAEEAIVMTRLLFNLVKIISEGKKEVALEAVAELERLMRSQNPVVRKQSEGRAMNLYPHQKRHFGRKMDEEVRFGVERLYKQALGIPADTPLI